MKKGALVSLAILVATGCQSTAPTETKALNQPFSTMLSAEKKLEKLIVDKSCDASYQCKVLPLGERACGGPSYFKIYSTKTADQEQVEFVASEITSFEQMYNETNNAFSTCQNAIAPQTLCISSTCEVVPVH